jgi:hypothetical protein
LDYELPGLDYGSRQAEKVSYELSGLDYGSRHAEKVSYELLRAWITAPGMRRRSVMSCSELGLRAARLGLRLQAGGEDQLVYEVLRAWITSCPAWITASGRRRSSVTAQSLDYELPGLDYGSRQAEKVSYQLSGLDYGSRHAEKVS